MPDLSPERLRIYLQALPLHNRDWVGVQPYLAAWQADRRTLAILERGRVTLVAEARALVKDIHEAFPEGLHGLGGVGPYIERLEAALALADEGQEHA